MSPCEIRRRALLAAAKVSFSLAAFGCGSADVPPSPDLAQLSGVPVCEASDGRCDGAAGQESSGVEASAGHGGAGDVNPPSGGVGGSDLTPMDSQAGHGNEASGSPGNEAGQGGEAGHLAQGGTGGGASSCGEDTVVPYESAHVQCCMDRISAVFPSPSTPPPETLSEEDAACCRVLVQSHDWAIQHSDETAPQVPWELANNCCIYPDVMVNGPTCTPWGPPAPPAMLSSLLDDFSWLAEAA